jgi:hypothetical protein
MIALFGFDFLRSGLWPLFGLVLMLFMLGLYALMAQRTARARLADKHLLAGLSANFSSNRARLRLGLEAASGVLIVLALLGPVRGYTEIPVLRRGLDIVICLDTSRSMLARDLAPDRLQRGRREVRGLLENLEGDRVALLAFSGDAREVAPLTRDRKALMGFLEGVSPADNRMGGTNLGAALERALAIFDGRTGAHEAIVVLTDGEDLEGEGLAVAKRAAEQGIGIYVVGLGTEQGGKIPLPGPNGSEHFLRGPDGSEVVTRLDRASLSQLAEVTGGAFLTTSDSPTPLEEIYAKRIGRLDRRELGGGDERVPHDRFQWALVPGVVLALLALGLRTKRPRKAAMRAATQAGQASSATVRSVGVALLSACLLGAAAGPGALGQEDAGSPDVGQDQPAAGGAEGAENVTGPEAEAPPRPAPFSDPAPQAAMVLEHVVLCADKGDLEDAMEWLEFSLGDLEQEPTSRLNTELGLDGDDTTPKGPVVTARFPWSDVERAHMRYAHGIVADLMAQPELAMEDFRSAAALAGPGELRTRSMYNQGTVQLMATEQKRSEFAAAAEAAGMPGGPPAPGAGIDEEQPEDPIAVLREGYGKSRDLLIENLRVAPRHADTRANLELIVRRLRELDAIEEQQQEEEQQEQEQDQEQDDQEQDDQEQDESDESEQSEQSDESEPSDESGDPQENQEEEQDPDEQPQEPEQEPDADEESDEEQQEQDQDQEQEPVEINPEDLTKEQLSRLLDQLRELEEQQAEMRERLQQKRQVPVDRDW